MQSEKRKMQNNRAKFQKRDFIKISDYLWEIPKHGRMQVPARVYASSQMLESIFRDKSLKQLVDVACLPGIQKYALAMPDCHEGYGFPIGGVAAFKNLISPGGVGFDINCGVRILKSDFKLREIKHNLERFAEQIQKNVPSGLAKAGKVKLDNQAMIKILEQGARRVVEQNYGAKQDLINCEENGSMAGADAQAVSERAKNRGYDQLGTLGSGNHFLEIQKVEQVFNDSFGLSQDQITIMIHTGSRGLGHQVATDYIREMGGGELVWAEFDSEKGKRYFMAMAAAANFAWANRQIITYLIRQALKIKLELIYDVAHNIAKIENDLCVHRKGATRALPGQIIIIPGSMGTASYLMIGEEKAKESFYSVAHGAGRVMSRTAARRIIPGQELKRKLEQQGIIVKAQSDAGLAEEAPMAYKNIDEVVEVISRAGLAKKAVKLTPLAVIKGE